MNRSKTSPSKEYCDYCKDYHDFVFPDDLFESIVNHEVVVFAGAGISTEGRNVFPSTLYQDILAEIGHSTDNLPSFSQAMSEFCRRKGGRRELIERITERIDYVRSFPKLYSSAVRCHRLLGMIPCIDEIVTTNWDDFFETECHATPFVYEPDMVFWGKPGRKVLKLHGSINNLGSMVITSRDYDERYNSISTGLVGSQLKLLIAAKTLLFVGYSFTDEDFNRLYSFVRSQLGDFMRKFYIVTLDKSNDGKWKDLGLTPIYTAAEYFLQVLIHKLQDRGCFISVDIINVVQTALDFTVVQHLLLSSKTKMAKYPEVIFCLSYQDGLINAFERFLHHVQYGESLCTNEILHALKTHDRLLKQKQARKKWYDVAYLKGYLNGYTFVIADEDIRQCIPYYWDLGVNEGFYTFKEYKKSLTTTQRKRKSISQYASQFVKRYPHPDTIVHHTPFL
ncbi:MAG: SIR2 family protein [Dehalococcoidia bacterium]|nr:SIR2 family protein [Dehalococcoidia bacterium]